MINEDGVPVTTTDNGGNGLTKPEKPMNTFKRVQDMIRRKKPEQTGQNGK